MCTMVLDGMFRAMTERVQRQQELIDQMRFDLETQNLENQGLARELAVVIDELSRPNRWDSTGEEVDSKSRLFRIGVQTEERNES